MRDHHSPLSTPELRAAMTGPTVTGSVLGFGELLWDLLPAGPALGGAPFNFAHRMHQFGYSASYISRVGADALGDDALQDVRRLGIDDSLIQRDRQLATGTVNITLDSSGVPEIDIVQNVAYDAITEDDAWSAVASSCACLCYGTLAQRGQVSREALSRLIEMCGDTIRVLDLNLRTDCWTPEVVLSSIATAQVLKLNEDEAPVVASVLGLPWTSPGQFCRDLLNVAPVDCCVVTLGPAGCLAINRQGDWAEQPGFAVGAVDTLGSGDAFTAGFIYRLLRGSPLADCCRLGNAMGAMTATQHGGTGPLDYAMVSDLLQEPFN